MIDETAGWLATLWQRDPGLLTAVAAGLLVVLVAGVACLVIWLARSGRLNAKLQIGTAVVQIGMTAAVVSGTYEFCHEVFQLPWWEALAFGIFLEAATWVAVGRILEHARDHTGMGYGGVFFWIFSATGGFLAVIAGDTPGEMVGRAAVMVVGTGLWFLTLLSHTTPGRLARRILIAFGSLQADDVDVPDEHREYQVRRLTRAIRWSNARGPLAWLGRRILVGRAEQTTEDVIAEARRRYAVAHHLVGAVAPTSEGMRALLDGIRDETTPSRRAQLDRQQAAIAAQNRLLLQTTAAALAAVHTDRAAVAAEQAAVARAREQLAAERQRPIPSITPTKDVPPAGGEHRSSAGGDRQLPDDVALLAKAVQFVAAQIVAGEPFGRRPFAEHVGMGRMNPSLAVPHTAALIHLGEDVSKVASPTRDDALQLLDQARDVLDLDSVARPTNGQHYPIPTTGA